MRRVMRVTLYAQKREHGRHTAPSYLSGGEGLWVGAGGKEVHVERPLLEGHQALHLPRVVGEARGSQGSARPRKTVCCAQGHERDESAVCYEYPLHTPALSTPRWSTVSPMEKITSPVTIPCSAACPLLDRTWPVDIGCMEVGPGGG